MTAISLDAKVLTGSCATSKLLNKERIFFVNVFRIRMFSWKFANGKRHAGINRDISEKQGPHFNFGQNCCLFSKTRVWFERICRIKKASKKPKSWEIRNISSTSMRREYILQWIMKIVETGVRWEVTQSKKKEETKAWVKNFQSSKQTPGPNEKFSIHFKLDAQTKGNPLWLRNVICTTDRSKEHAHGRFPLQS